MRRQGWICLALGMMLVGGGCKREDSDRLARVGKRAAHRAEVLTGDLHSRLGSNVSGLSLGELRLAARVDARLRWDKALEGAQIEARASGAQIELRGSLRDESQRARAVELAESTLGVDNVKDEMKVRADE